MDATRLKALGRYFEERPKEGVSAAYLFGSHAAGRAHRESDVDVAVLLDWERHPSRRDRFDVRLRLGSELGAIVGTPEVDVVIVNDAPPLFARRIVYEGVPVYRGDPEAEHAFVRDVQLRAADLEPFLRRMRRIKLDALAS